MKDYLCIDCNKPRSPQAKRCALCVKKYRVENLSKQKRESKINWPPLESLFIWLETSSSYAIAKQLNVNRNTLKNHIITEVNKKKKELEFSS